MFVLYFTKTRYEERRSGNTGACRTTEGAGARQIKRESERLLLQLFVSSLFVHFSFFLHSVAYLLPGNVTPRIYKYIDLQISGDTFLSSRFLLLHRTIIIDWVPLIVSPPLSHVLKKIHFHLDSVTIERRKKQKRDRPACIAWKKILNVLFRSTRSKFI